MKTQIDLSISVGRSLREVYSKEFGELLPLRRDDFISINDISYVVQDCGFVEDEGVSFWLVTTKISGFDGSEGRDIIAALKRDGWKP